jgi:hypothetical protein
MKLVSVADKWNEFMEKNGLSLLTASFLLFHAALSVGKLNII